MDAAATRDPVACVKPRRRRTENAISGAPVPVAKGIVFTTMTETFAPGEDTRVYLSIGSSNESVLPAAGYTVGISS